MGYTTKFEGSFKLNRELTLKEYKEFMKLGGYDESEYKNYSKVYPSSYNQWVLNTDADAIVWNGAEKFYEYVEWLQWLIDNFFCIKALFISGTVLWQGEEVGDVGEITVKNNIVSTRKLDTTGEITCPDCGSKFNIS